MNPLFSVVVVNYEQTHLLKACLTSIFDQIYDNIELIICDDASCDFDLQEIEAYIEKVKSGNIKNVVVFQQDRFKGFSASCQKGFELARGEYIKYLTPEDSFIDNSVISRAQKLFVEFGADVLATNLALTNPATGTATEQAIFHYEGSCVNPAVAFENLATQDDESFIFSQSAFLKRETIEKAGGFDLRYEQVAFWPLWLKAALGGALFCYSNQKMIIHTAFAAATFQPQLTEAEAVAKNKERLEILETYVEPRMKTHLSLYARLKCFILEKRIKQSNVAISDWPFMSFFERLAWLTRNSPYLIIKKLYAVRTADHRNAFKTMSALVGGILLLLKTDLSANLLLPMREILRVMLYLTLFLDLIYLSFILLQQFGNWVVRGRHGKK